MSPCSRTPENVVCTERLETSLTLRSIFRLLPEEESFQTLISHVTQSVRKEEDVTVRGRR